MKLSDCEFKAEKNEGFFTHHMILNDETSLLWQSQLYTGIRNNVAN